MTQPAKRPPRKRTPSHRPARDQPEPLRERLLRYATSRNPPAGAGMLALAGWTLWMATIVRERWRNHLIGAAGLFIVIAVFINRIASVLRQRREAKEKEREKPDP